LSVVSVLGLMILPVPSSVLDLLLAVNIMAALAIMLTSMHIEKPLDFYRQIDVAINPTHVPSGLKIKSVEAIGAGCCLVTNSVGAAGLESLVDRSIRVAGDANEFADHLETWFSDPASRMQAAQYALEYAREFLAEHRVYRELFDWMG
ncbi:MAG: FHIPEP family type III secretion protein, partial [Planctomycetota bacterium]|nr:FHIPEP family type III secretion protein [Planctomycetota bacterium]